MLPPPRILRTRTLRTILPGVLILLCLAPGLAADEARPALAGRPLREALLALQKRGLRLVFTSEVVREDMRVVEEPAAGRPRTVLDELLRPHGLAAREGPAGVLMVVRAPAPRPRTRVAGSVRERDGGRPLAGVLFTGDSIVVAARPGRLLGDAASSLSLDRKRLMSLPQIGEDVLRPLSLLPGTSGTGLSAELSVRGGRQDEMLLRLDGLEIFEPYHLKDFNNALSILAPATIGVAELSTGGFSAEYGDRMGGVLDLRTVDPEFPATELGVSTQWAQANSSGSWRRGRADWLASLRAGAPDAVAQAAEEEEDPRFGDLSAKIDVAFGASRTLRANALYSQDRLDFDPTGDAFDVFRSRYSNLYAWLTFEVLRGSSLYLETMASYSRIDHDRRGSEQDDAGQPTLDDRRRFEVATVRQGWNLDLGGRHELKWGLETRDLDVVYDYVNQRTLDDPLAAVLDRPAGVTRFDQGFGGEQYAAYVADRVLAWKPLTVELGLRFDENALLDEEHFSPRLSVAHQLGERTRLRLAWGKYYQSQRAYELQVEDGETRFVPDEHAEHRILGVEHTLGVAGAGRRPWILRAELYQRQIRNPRVRYENLFDPVSVAPELEADRVRIAPVGSLSRGLELFLGGNAGRRVDWFVSYTYSRVEDRIEGRDVPRGFDQPHALQLDADVRSPWGWDFNVSADLHSGRPTTAVTAHLDHGTIVPDLGPFYGERLPSQVRLDLRASRRWSFARADLELFVNVHNLTDRDNVRGFEVDFVPLPDGRVDVVKTKKTWGGIFPSVGIRWTW